MRGGTRRRRKRKYATIKDCSCHSYSSVFAFWTHLNWSYVGFYSRSFMGMTLMCVLRMIHPMFSRKSFSIWFLWWNAILLYWVPRSGWSLWSGKSTPFRRSSWSNRWPMKYGQAFSRDHLDHVLVLPALDHCVREHESFLMHLVLCAHITIGTRFAPWSVGFMWYLIAKVWEQTSDLNDIPQWLPKKSTWRNRR
jgi:hypothetical protein